MALVTLQRHAPVAPNVESCRLCESHIGGRLQDHLLIGQPGTAELCATICTRCGDTVERLQGDERPTVIVSATASDPSAIAQSAEFILDLNRANVAFSRTEDRLIVVCSSALLDHMPVEVEHYESAMLWKALRTLCTEVVAHTEIEGHEVTILTPRLQAVQELAAAEQR